MELRIGDAVRGEVTAIKPYGAFVRLPNGEVGMVHISEIAEEYVSDINSYTTVGEEITVKIVGKNAEGKFNLSIKRLTKQDEEGALFSHEVERVRVALERRNGWIKDRIIRRRRPEQESLPSWIEKAKSKLARLEKRHLDRVSKMHLQGSMTSPDSEKGGFLRLNLLAA